MTHATAVAIRSVCLPPWLFMPKRLNVLSDVSSFRMPNFADRVQASPGTSELNIGTVPVKSDQRQSITHVVQFW